jgi:hypothetical protein
MNDTAAGHRSVILRLEESDEETLYISIIRFGLPTGNTAISSLSESN